MWSKKLITQRRGAIIDLDHVVIFVKVTGRMGDSGDSRRKSVPFGVVLLRVAAVLVIVAGVVVAVIAFSHDTVCNQQLTAAGKTVAVCRHLEITDPPVIVGGLVVLAALGAFFPEISGFGLSLKRDVADAKDAAQSAEKAAESASRASKAAEQVAKDAETASVSAKQAAKLAEQTSEQARAAASSAQSVAQVAQDLSLSSSSARSRDALEGQRNLEQEIRVLADEYNATRRAMPSGVERTSKMTSIVSKMIALLNNVNTDQFDVSAYLDSPDPGLRLAGYVFLYANPEPSRLQQIVSTLLENEEKPFVQYWALRTVRRQLQVDSTALDLNTKRRLSDLLSHLGPGTDRAYELREILRESPS